MAFLTSVAGCALEHKASTRFVDPRLKAATLPVVAERSRGHVVELSPWRLRDVEVTRLRDGGRLGLGGDGSGNRGTANLYRLELRVTAPSRPDWIAYCEGRRGRPPAADYAAVLDENHDEIAMRCELHADRASAESSGEAAERWIVETGGTLRNNVIGRATTPARKGTYEIEILTRYRLFNLVRRATPVALAQVRTGAGAVAAMTLARPEHLWIAERDHADAGLWLTILSAHRFMPLGWND